LPHIWAYFFSMQNRYPALDVFRGLTVTLMIVVNTPGNYQFVYPPLAHAVWNGFTPTDLVFPSFLFAVGNAMSFALPKYEQLGRQTFLLKILRRTALIFLLGYLMYWFPFFSLDVAGQFQFSPVSHTRILGVLQRIALCYGLASVVVYFFRERGALIFSILALTGYWFILLSFGDLTLEGNAVRRLDLWLMGENHLYHGYESAVPGNKIAFDPEGWLSTLPAIVNVIAGYLTGKFIREKGQNYETLARLMLAGTTLLAGAYLWNLVLPINKPLWSSSYVLHTIGLDLLILPVLIFVIDFQKRDRWTYFFVVFGRNTLFCYLLSELIPPLLWTFSIDKVPVYLWLYTHFFQPLGNFRGSLLFALFYMLLIWAVGWWLDKRRIYIKV
jgi:predicted acyltransferase